MLKMGYDLRSRPLDVKNGLRPPFAPALATVSMDGWSMGMVVFLLRLQV